MCSKTNQKLSEISKLKLKLRNAESKYLNAKKRVEVLKKDKKELQSQNNKTLVELKKAKEEIKKLKLKQEIDKQTIEEYKRIIFH